MKKKHINSTFEDRRALFLVCLLPQETPDSRGGVWMDDYPRWSNPSIQAACGDQVFKIEHEGLQPILELVNSPREINP